MPRVVPVCSFLLHTVLPMTKPTTENKSAADVTIRPATRDDLPALAQLITGYVKANRLLPRTQSELDDLIPFGFVACLSDRVVGFAALEIYSSKLAEVRSLAVAPEMQGNGLGKRLVQECVELAQSRNVLEVMAITSAEDFFQSCGFDFTLPGEKKALFVRTREEL